VLDPLIIDSARKHNIADADILHAFRNAMRVFPNPDGMRMVIGGDRTGDLLLEVGVVDSDDGGPVIVHAMRARPKYLR
jgi:hypothetical protein